MTDRELEHPDVTRIQRDGYASGHEPLVFCACSECGEPIYYGDRAMLLRGWGWVCEDCVEGRMTEVGI